jgi:hypothetical protein
LLQLFADAAQRLSRGHTGMLRADLA